MRALAVAPSPHIANTSLTTRSIMVDVLIGLSPVLVAALVVFGFAALVQVLIATVTACLVEALGQRLRGRPLTLADGSAAVTGVIIGLSLPWSAPFWVPMVAALVGVGIGKVLFGGLGHNMFNPAMVGRAFVTISFSQSLAAPAYRAEAGSVVTQATPLTGAAVAAGEADMPGFLALFIGNHNGSLGETSVLAVLLGGIYMCLRRTAAWEVPVSLLATVGLLAGLGQLAPAETIARLPALGFGVDGHLLAGAVVFGAFFIATDPVSNPLTVRGKIVFGVGVGFLTWLLRVFSAYPEGFMFAILLMNAVVPLINRICIPDPVGGKVPVRR